MFTRIMAVVLAVIVVLTLGFSVMGVVAVNNQQVTGRLNQLTSDARDVAYLAAHNHSTSAASEFFGVETDAQKYLEWKSRKIYEDWGAYIMLVDRKRRVMDNMNLAGQDDPEFVASLNSKELNDAFNEVLNGGEIAVRTFTGGEASFTVGVPYVRNDRVLGAVLIHTKAQAIEGDVWSVTRPVIIIALITLLLSGVLIFFYVRRIMRPLRDLTEASRAMTNGDFSVRVEGVQSAPEIREMANAFNTMADQLGDTERSRREFVANVSHELRSPITAISGFVQGMEDGTIPPEDHPKYLKLVGDETRRLTKLIQDLLALSRLERDDATLDIHDFDICEMLRRAIIRRMGDLERKQMEVDCDFREDPCMVRADSDRIEQVVVNLVDNALKFTPQHGRLRLITEDSGDCMTITVADNGTGILPEDRPHVFERFFTADRAHTAGKGTGLGLSICQRILEMHGQSIRLLDTREGAAFAFTLAKGTPRAKAPEDEDEDETDLV